jgi:hypothetical protein
MNVKEQDRGLKMSFNVMYGKLKGQGGVGGQ